MANVGQIYYRVIDNFGNYISGPTENINIYDNIVKNIFKDAHRFIKLGVQAPPGTKMIINETKSIMVGRTGIYELDEGIQITSLRFIKPRKYIKDEGASQDAKTEGAKEMKAAEEVRSKALEILNSSLDKTEDAYWESYKAIQTNYITAYEEALGKYNSGVNGIYVLPNPDNINAEENYEDLYNVIIDVIYE